MFVNCIIIYPCAIIFQEKNRALKSRAAQLERQIKVLIDDSVALLRSRISELGMTAANPEDLLNRAKVLILMLGEKSKG